MSTTWALRLDLDSGALEVAVGGATLEASRTLADELFDERAEISRILVYATDIAGAGRARRARPAPWLRRRAGRWSRLG